MVRFFNIFLCLLFLFFNNSFPLSTDSSFFSTGFISEEKENYSEAIEFYGKVRVDSPLYPYSTIRKARCLLKIGEIDNAILILRSLYENSSGQDVAWIPLLVFDLFSAYSLKKEYHFIPEVRNIINTFSFSSWWLLPYLHNSASHLLTEPNYRNMGSDLLKKILEYKGYSSPRKQALMTLALSPDESDRLYVLELLVKGGSLFEAWLIMQNIYDTKWLSYTGSPAEIKNWGMRDKIAKFVEFMKTCPKTKKNKVFLEYIIKCLVYSNNLSFFEEIFGQLGNIYYTDEEKGDLLYWCAQASEKQASDNKTEELCLRFIREFPMHKKAPDIHFLLGSWYLKKGRVEDAKECFKIIRDKYEHSYYFPRASYLYGKICEEKGDKRDAVISYRLAVKGKLGDYYVHKSAERLYKNFDIRSFEKLRFIPLKKLGVSAIQFGELQKPEEVVKSNKEEVGEIWDLLKFFSQLGAEEKEWITYWLIQKYSCREKNGKILLGCVNLGSPQVVWDYLSSFPREEKNGFADDVKNFIMFPLPYFEVLTDISRRYGVDPFLIWSIMRQESTYRTDVISSSDARGLLQVLPSTARWVVEKKMVKVEKDPVLWRVPEHNIEIGVAYFKYLLERFDGNVIYAISAYNAGPGKITQWLSNRKFSDLEDFIENIPYMETRNYVKKVLGNYSAYYSIYESIKD
ncbi:MAG: transglycosylase SLT domain-containing protein [Candidatus Hydrogenedentes bacterium]|nr:transglycosylase SLT domain-containing protein [Candidatus Hydrogenedentota bacterium]